MEQNNIEQRALTVGAVVNLTMALAGWVAYYFAGSQALLLDGNFSFIGFLSTLAAVRITATKANTSELFPFEFPLGNLSMNRFMH